MKFPVISLLSLALAASAIGAESSSEEALWKKLSEQDNKANATGICQVHQKAMEKTEVPIHYGLPGPVGADQPTLLQRARLFPHARKFILGGCMPIENETRSTIYVCSSCLDAEKKWLAANKKK